MKTRWLITWIQNKDAGAHLLFVFSRALMPVTYLRLIRYLLLLINLTDWLTRGNGGNRNDLKRESPGIVVSANETITARYNMRNNNSNITAITKEIISPLIVTPQLRENYGLLAKYKPVQSLQHHSRLGSAMVSTWLIDIYELEHHSQLSSAHG